MIGAPNNLFAFIDQNDIHHMQVDINKIFGVCIVFFVVLLFFKYSTREPGAVKFIERKKEKKRRR